MAMTGKDFAEPWSHCAHARGVTPGKVVNGPVISAFNHLLNNLPLQALEDNRSPSLPHPMNSVGGMPIAIRPA